MPHNKDFSCFLSCFSSLSPVGELYLRRLYSEMLVGKGPFECRKEGEYLVFYERGKRLEPHYYIEGRFGLASGNKEKFPVSSVNNFEKLRVLTASLEGGAPAGFDSFGVHLADEPARRAFGLYFTGSSLAGFTANYIRNLLGPSEYGNLFFFDPAAGSGNLLLALSAPGRIMGADINPGNIAAQQKRNVPCAAAPVDFLKAGSQRILSLLPVLPLFFIMNPPYRGKSTGKTGKPGVKQGVSASYSAGAELKTLFKREGLRSLDLSSFFIVRALSILEARGGGYLGVFTPTNWLTGGRKEHEGLRRYVFRKAGFLGGFLVNGKDHFPGVRSGMPVAFSVFKFGAKGRDEVFSDLSGSKGLISGAQSRAEARTRIKTAPRAVLSAGNRVFFKDIFRAINAQTGDDRRLLQDIRVRDGKGVLPESLKDISGERVFLAATDRKTGYAAAVKPLKKKKSGCQFTISRELPGPALAWHYLWGYLKTYPARMYNAVPVVRKYAYTYIEPRAILTAGRAKASGAVRRGACEAQPSGAYISEWLKEIGDLRGLWYFYYALAGSAAAGKIGNRAAYKNMPVWCPPLNEKTAPQISLVCEYGYAAAVSRYSGKFLSFKLFHRGRKLASAVNFFEGGSFEPLSGKHLSKGPAGGILEKSGGLESLKSRAEDALRVLYPESGE